MMELKNRREILAKLGDVDSAWPSGKAQRHTSHASVTLHVGHVAAWI